MITSANRPKRCLEIQDEDANDDHDANASPDRSEQVIVHESADPDARWTKKAQSYYFGYKGFVGVEGQHGCIRTCHVTSANRSEVKELEETVGETGSLKAVLADKGYASASNRAWLKSKGIEDGIMRKGKRNHPLTEEEKHVNRLISRVRFKVEQCFGTLKRRFGMGRARYKTVNRVSSELYWKAMCFNLLKASRLIGATFAQKPEKRTFPVKIEGKK